MKKFLLRLILFMLPLLVILLALPVNKRLFYRGLKENCMNQGIWIYDRINNNSKPVDIVFLGSSHTCNGISDSLIERLLAEKNLKVVNLGYCQLGNNLQYVLLKEAVKTKKIKILVFEVREEENRFGHPAFAYLADSKDVLSAAPLFNQQLFEDYYRHCYYKLEVIRKFLFGTLENEAIQTNDFGFSCSAEASSPDFLDDIKRRRSASKFISGLERDVKMRFARTYIAKIADVCHEQNIRMLFLYLPGYGSILDKPMEYDTYIKYGTVLIPPKEILDKKENWHDEDHLNYNGSRELSGWIAAQLQAMQ
jgi:hypothetical protein